MRERKVGDTTLRSQPAKHGGYVLEADRRRWRMAFGPICATEEAAEEAIKYVAANADEMHMDLGCWPKFRDGASWESFRKDRGQQHYGPVR